MFMFFFIMMLTCPLTAAAMNIVGGSRPRLLAKLAGYMMGLGLLTAAGLLALITPRETQTVAPGLRLDNLNLLLCSLILTVSFVAHRFSLRYMDGDRLYRRFFTLLSSLTVSTLMMVLADNLLLFWAAWSCSNLFLILLMIHKKEWAASKHSGILAFYVLGSGSTALLAAVILLCKNGSTSSLYELTQTGAAGSGLAVGLILFSALAQSGLFPFHRWLISSLNSPTPVSSIMHAGLINGGGILIVKFASIIMLHHSLMNLLFLLGALSATLGTIWKLMQYDIKKMLSCSTMAQMGFMMMQCGLGLFAAAIAHICWHGLFKAYLFFSSGSGLNQKKTDIKQKTAFQAGLPAALAGGAIAAACFAAVTQTPVSFYQSSTFILFFACITGTQLMISWMEHQQSLMGFLLGLVLASVSGLIYGASILFIEKLLPGLSNKNIPSLSPMHWVIMSLFAMLWIGFNLKALNKFSQSKIGCWLYMNLFNASQPAAKTMTSIRSDYRF